MDQVLLQLLGALPSAFSGGGLTGGTVLAIFGRLIATEKLWFNRSVQRVIDEKDKQLADLREQTTLRITEKDAELTRMKEELDRMTLDRNYWRESDTTNRKRADVATDFVADQFTPLMRQVNKTFEQFTEAAKAVPE